MDQVFCVRRLLEERVEFGLPVAVAALDFSAAYDSVDREVLWRVLELEGVGHGMLRVLRALGERTRCRVKVEGQCSEGFEVKSGVRQGSVLSPLLFGVVMDWVMRKAVGEGGEGVLVAPGTRVSDLDFADDVLLVGESLDVLRKAVEAVEREGAVFGLRLNPAKTKWMGSPGVGRES